jgi:hypothetical protein
VIALHPGGQSRTIPQSHRLGQQCWSFLYIQYHPLSSGLNYISALNMLHENALGLSAIVWRELEGQQRTARVTLKQSDRRRLLVATPCHLSLYLVLLRGELKISPLSFSLSLLLFPSLSPPSPSASFSHTQTRARANPHTHTDTHEYSGYALRHTSTVPRTKGDGRVDLRRPSHSESLARHGTSSQWSHWSGSSLDRPRSTCVLLVGQFDSSSALVNLLRLVVRWSPF